MGEKANQYKQTSRVWGNSRGSQRGLRSPGAAKKVGGKEATLTSKEVA